MGYLERTMGHAGKIALRPFIGGAGRDRWQLEVLRQEG
jgi:hypothetical protein